MNPSASGPSPTSPTSPSSAPPAWLAIAGPTASGKTALALALARQYPLEIISIDSACLLYTSPSPRDS